MTLGLGFLKSSPPDAQPDVKDEAEDIDFVDEDLEEEPVENASDGPPGFDGPRSWEEVEENESQRVSLSISSHAVPSNDSGEAAARLAWQAAALEAENQDPLGLGRVDAHGLRLVRDFRIEHNISRKQPWDVEHIHDRSQPQGCFMLTGAPRQKLSQNSR